MADTSSIDITSSWTKISDGDCTLQSLVNAAIFDVSVGGNRPTGDSFITLQLTEPTTFAYQSPVWCRVKEDKPQAIVIIK